MLRNAGVQDVQVPETQLRPTLEQFAEFSDDGYDIIVGGKITVEVKERRLRFTGPNDFPYPDMIVDVAHKRCHADVYIITSQGGEHAIVLDGTRRDDWFERSIFDRQKARMRNFVLAPRSAAMSFEAGVAHCFFSA